MSDNKEHMRQYMLARYHKRREKALHDLGGKCVVCGTTEQLEFDHIDSTSKSYSIGQIMTSGSEAKLQAELAKCQLLCKSHHAEKSKRDGDYRRNHGPQVLR